jgi:hypothetical protein
MKKRQQRTIISGYTPSISLTSSFDGVYELHAMLYTKLNAPKHSVKIKIIKEE